MRIFFLLSSLLFLQFCDSMISSTASQNANSSKLEVLSSNTKLSPIPGKIQLIQDSFVFYYPDNKRGFFLYPQTNLELFKTHFFVQLAASDVIVCGVLEKPGIKKKLTIKAELLKDYNGDISAIASFCSGKGATIYTDDGKSTTTINPSFIPDSFHVKEHPRLIFPYIPNFPSSLDDIASPGNTKVKIFVKIEFFDRISKTTLTNCTYYKINDEEDDTCYAVPMIYPETSFYGERYRTKQLASVKALSEYLEKE